MNTENSSFDHPAKGATITPEELEHIRAALKGMKFGSVQITIQDGVVIQIDRTEKRRLRTARERGKVDNSQ